MIGLFSGSQPGTTIDMNPMRDAQIRQYLQQNPNATDYDMLLEAQRFGATPEDIARATGSNLGQIQSRFSQAEQVQRYNLQNPNANPLQMLQAAQTAGYSPQDIQRISGYSPQQILQTNQPTSSSNSGLFSNVARNYVQDKLISSLLMSNPYTAALGSFYQPARGLFRGIRNLFG